MKVRRDHKTSPKKKLYTTWWQETNNQNARAKRWVEMHFPRSEMRIDPRNDQTKETTTKYKNGAGAQRNQQTSHQSQ